MEIEKVPCTDCKLDVWGKYLVMHKNEPFHTWCYEKRRRVSRLYTFRGM